MKKRSMAGNAAFAADLPTGDRFETPQNLTVELEGRKDGRPSSPKKGVHIS
ncbi:MAG: hypothetical protein ACOX4L_05770 [Bacillota bacterium]|jgi:hypothetical protein